MATNDKLTAFNINSMDIKIMSGLRRMSTPTTPIVKIIALTMRYADNGIDTSRATTQNQGDHKGRPYNTRFTLSCPVPSRQGPLRLSAGLSPQRDRRNRGKGPGQRLLCCPVYSLHERGYWQPLPLVRYRWLFP